MIAAERVAAVLLAAGRSERFGATDKLMAAFDGKPLVAHAAGMLGAIGFGARMAVCGRSEESAALLGGLGFEIIVNDAPEAGQSRSIALGVTRALAGACDAVLICLGDMPGVTTGHVEALLDRFDPAEIIASSCDGQAMPPVLFSRERAGALLALDGDRGARGLLSGAALVPADANLLSDIDRPEQMG